MTPVPCRLGLGRGRACSVAARPLRVGALGTAELPRLVACPCVCDRIWRPRQGRRRRRGAYLGRGPRLGLGRVGTVEPDERGAGDVGVDADADAGLACRLRDGRPAGADESAWSSEKAWGGRGGGACEGPWRDMAWDAGMRGRWADTHWWHSGCDAGPRGPRGEEGAAGRAGGWCGRGREAGVGLAGPTGQDGVELAGDGTGWSGRVGDSGAADAGAGGGRGGDVCSEGSGEGRGRAGSRCGEEGSTSGSGRGLVVETRGAVRWRKGLQEAGTEPCAETCVGRELGGGRPGCEGSRGRAAAAEVLAD